MNRSNRRDRSSVIGSVATLSASASQLVRVWIARQFSSQRETTRPASSWARNRDGTASRPLSSTECRYSPVNTCLGSPVRVWCLVVAGATERSAHRSGVLQSSVFPTLVHFAPLLGIIARSEGPSMAKTHDAADGALAAEGMAGAG